jgi:hypothetical protein
MKTIIEKNRIFIAYDIDINNNEKHFQTNIAVEKVLSSSCHP